MDGIDITRVVNSDPVDNVLFGCNVVSDDYPFTINDVPEEEIKNIIKINEGYIPDEHDFKHSVKLTPNLTHPSLKKRINSRRNLNEMDDEDAIISSADDINTIPVNEVKEPRLSSFKNSDLLLRARIKKTRKLLRSLNEEVAALREERRKLKHDLELERKELEREIKKLNRDLQKRLILLQKYDDTVKKRGRRCGSVKLRRELGIDDKTDASIDVDDHLTEEDNGTKHFENLVIKKEPVDVGCGVKRGRGRPKKIQPMVQVKKEKDASDFENIPVCSKKRMKRRQSSLGSETDSMIVPLKEKNLNKEEIAKIGRVLKFDVPSAVITKLKDKNKVTKDESSLSSSSSSPRRSKREVRCTEKFADLVQTTRRLDAESFLIRKTIAVAKQESIHEETPKPLEEISKKRKSVEEPKKDSTKKIKNNHGALLQSIDRTESSGSESNSVSCRNIKQAKIAMMKGVTSKKICEKCMEGLASTSQCQKCFSYFHPKCVGDTKEDVGNDWVCPICVSGKNPCFVCKSSEKTRQMCLKPGCGKYYHSECLKLFPQTKFNHDERKGIGLIRDVNDTSPAPLEILACARHFCHTCASDNPFDAACVPIEKLLSCLKCPTSYHCSPGVCLSAGTEMLTKKDIICGKHFDPSPSSRMHHINITWCLVCTKGGELTNCALCPSAIHPECLQIKRPDGPYYCDECESGRFPLHGEIVWVKLGNYRWWPSKIIYPDEAPSNLIKTKRKQCEFPVMFFGTNNYQWVNRGRAYLFDEGDGQNNFHAQKRLDKTFQLALEEASEAFRQRKQTLEEHTSTVKEKPKPYIKIRSNKYSKNVKKHVGREPQVCDCSASDADPCGAASNCLNRGLLIECSPDFCPAGEKCRNQRFAKRDYPPMDLFKTTDRGWGVRCREDILQGQFVVEYVGQVIDEAELERRMKIKREAKNSRYYFLRLDANQVLDAEPMGNTARFINHSCRPNCETQKWSVSGVTKIGIFACQDIPKGTELTFNYDWNISGMRSLCYCGDAGCSGVIGEIPKVEKTTKVKVTKKKLKMKPKMTDSSCYKCKQEGPNLVICSSSKCPRVIHVECANLSKEQTGEWLCSLHFCIICGQKTKRHCKECLEAYCASHTTNYIFPNTKGELFCAQHVIQKRYSNLRKSTYLSRKEILNNVDNSSSSSFSTDPDVPTQPT